MSLSQLKEEYEKDLRDSYDDNHYPLDKKSKYETIDKQINEIDYGLERIKPKYFNPKNDREELRNIIINRPHPQGLHEYEDKLYSLIMREPIIKKENFLRSLSQSISKKDMAILNLKLLDYSVLKEIMETCGSFPEKSRNYIWKYLLSLPGDKNLFEFYSVKGIHPFYKNLKDFFKVKDNKEYRRLQQICSIISFWSPHVGNVYFLPNFIYPFIKAIQGDDLFIFELLIAIFNTFCQYWFEFYPGAPLNHLKICEKILAKESNKLYSHFKLLEKETNDSSMKLSEIIWKLLKSIFSDSLCKENWCQLIDFILTYNHKPEIVMYVSCSYLLSLENLLMKCKCQADVDSILFSGVNKNLNLSLIKIFKNSERLMEKYSRYQIFKYKPHFPFMNDRYPKIDKFPLDFLGTTAKLKEELFREEENFELKKKKIDEIESKFYELARKEKMMQKCYESLIHKEKEKGEIMKRELDLITYQKEKFYDEMKNRKILKVSKLENLIGSSLKFYDKMKVTEIATFEEGMRKKKSLEEFDMKQRLQQEELNNLEFDANRKILHLMNLRVKDEEYQKFKMLEESKEKEREMKNRIHEENWNLEDEGNQKNIENLRNLKEMEYIQNKEDNYFKNKELKEKIKDHRQNLLIQEVNNERKNRNAQQEYEENRIASKDNLSYKEAMPRFNQKNSKGQKQNVNLSSQNVPAGSDVKNSYLKGNNIRDRTPKDSYDDKYFSSNSNSPNNLRKYDYPYLDDNRQSSKKNIPIQNSSDSNVNDFSSPTISSDNKNSAHTNLQLINEGIRNFTSTSSPYNNYLSSKIDSSSQDNNSSKNPFNFSEQEFYPQEQAVNKNKYEKLNQKEFNNSNDLLTSNYRSNSNDGLEEGDYRYGTKNKNFQGDNQGRSLNSTKNQGQYDSQISFNKSNNFASLGSLSLSQSNR